MQENRFQGSPNEAPVILFVGGQPVILDGNHSLAAALSLEAEDISGYYTFSPDEENI